MSLSVSEYTGSGVTIFLNSSILRITKPGKRSLIPSARVLLPLPGKPVIQMTRPLMLKHTTESYLIPFPGLQFSCFLAVTAEQSEGNYFQPFHAYFFTAFFAVAVTSFIEPFQCQLDFSDTLQLRIELPAAHMLELIEYRAVALILSCGNSLPVFSRHELFHLVCGISDNSFPFLIQHLSEVLFR